MKQKLGLNLPPAFFFSAAGLTNATTGFPGANPYVISPQDQQYLAAAAAAGQLLPGNETHSSFPFLFSRSLRNPNSGNCEVWNK